MFGNSKFTISVSPKKLHETKTQISARKIKMILKCFIIIYLLADFKNVNFRRVFLEKFIVGTKNFKKILSVDTEEKLQLQKRLGL